MALFAQSQTSVSAAVQQIADSVGASADSEMLSRALVSLNAATKHFNSRAKWNWLWTEASPISVVAPFGVTGVTASAAQSSALVPAGHGFKVDDYIAGSGFAVGTRISATAAASFGFTAAITGFSGSAAFSVTAARDMYDLPSDYKDTFSARLVTKNRTLRPMPRRVWDRIVADEYATSSVFWYNLFQVGAKGKVQVLPPPSEADVLQVRYFRYMATASASGVGSNLDIPADYDEYLIAWAKWHFITDKGEGRAEQGRTWFALAQEGLATMLRDQTTVQDEDLMFRPGWIAGPFVGDDRTTRTINFDFA